MKTLKRIALLLVVVLMLVVIANYPKLNMIAGYSAKSTASSVFLANRTLSFTDSTDNKFPLVELADDKINKDKKYATSSVFGLLTRKAIYREGLGAVLTIKGFDNKKKPLVPNRVFNEDKSPYPYGNGNPKDTVFANVDYKKIKNAINYAFEPNHKTRSVLILHKNQILGERYAEGFDKNSRILGWSMTKSIVATIFGIMQYQGKIDVQTKAPIAQWQNDARKEITIHNLLQMNSGLEWDENYDRISDVTQMLFLEEDMTQMQRGKALTSEINKSWNYSSGTSNLLSGIIREQIGDHQEYLDFWYRELIDKIGMNSMVVETDLAGNYVGSSYAWATTRDWAKFGLLYLNNGTWKGEQIFDKNWSKYVATPTPTSNGRYGAQFWLNAEGRLKDVPKNMYYADGFQGQRVYILPDQEMIVVRFGLTGDYDENKFLKEILEAIQ